MTTDAQNAEIKIHVNFSWAYQFNGSIDLRFCISNF